MKGTNLLPIAVSVLLISACSNNTEETTSDNNINIPDSTTITVSPTRDEIFSEQEIRNMDRNYYILIDYIKISDDSTSYTLNISKEDAVKLGVDKEYYQSTLESIRNTNNAIKEALKRGDYVEITDFQTLTNKK